MVTTDLGVAGVLPVEPFRLDLVGPSSPVSFDVMFLAGGTIYRYYLEATPDRVLEESLETVTEKRDGLVFERDEVHGSYNFRSGVFSPRTPSTPQRARGAISCSFKAPSHRT